ncbi:acyl-CoA synthetase/AMP-acid ligase-like protein II [Tirmania nivea]|nr:acyl-CoA synthetase/AMP-acid ligase-like protein II [Tirmania nivea]
MVLPLRTVRLQAVLRLPGVLCTLKRSLLTHSYYKGPSEPPLLEQTVGSHLAEIASQYGDSNAVISRHQRKRLTYDQLHEQSNTLARGLLKAGVKKGDRVAVSLGNNVEFAILHYALFKIGAILVPLNPSFNVGQVAAALNHLGSTHLIISLEANLARKPPRSTIPILETIAPSLGSSQWVESELVPTLKSIITVDNTSGINASAYKALTKFEDVFQDGRDSRVDLSSIRLVPDEIINIQFTSGTTSTPKAACLTHRSILNNGKSIGDRMLLTPKDVVCCPPPLFHCFGSVLGYMASATHGSAIVFPSEAFDPLATLQTVREEKCTALYGVPTMFSAELELLQNKVVPYEGFQYLRTGIAAGSSVPAELMKKLHRILNLTELTICYGMTETSPVSAQTTTNDPLIKRLDSVGRLLPHVEAKIVSATDKNIILPIRQKGELAVSGYLVQKGYWNDPARSAEVMIKDKHGKVWMHTGDEAEMDAEGYIKITGRLKDLIIRGGENIHPLEIENILFAHPLIAEASVVGLKDPHYGEAVATFIIPNSSPTTPRISHAEVREWVMEKLSGHLVPKYVFFVETYPKTASGKIMKYVLREEGERLVKEGKGVE